MTRPPCVVYANRRPHGLPHNNRVDVKFSIRAREATTGKKWVYYHCKSPFNNTTARIEAAFVVIDPAGACAVWWAAVSAFARLDAQLPALFGEGSQVRGVDVLWDATEPKDSARRAVAEAVLQLLHAQALGTAAPEERIYLRDTKGVVHEMDWLEAVACNEEIWVQGPMRSTVPTCIECIAATSRRGEG